MPKQPLATEGTDLTQWRPLLKQLSSLGFSNEEIHSNLIDRGLSDADAMALIKGNEQERKEFDAAYAKANSDYVSTGCVSTLLILAIALFVFVWIVLEVIGAAMHSR